MPNRVALLVVAEDPDVCRLALEGAGRRGWVVAQAADCDAVSRQLDARSFAAAVVDLGLSGNPERCIMRLLKQKCPDTVVVAVSSGATLSCAMTPQSVPAFALLQTPLDETQLFSTLDRALEHRRINLDNRHLLWELQTLNEITDGITRSLELREILAGALERLVPALGLRGGSIRIKDERTGEFVEEARFGPELLKQFWTSGVAGVTRPSDRVIATGRTAVAQDLSAAAPGGEELPIRSAMSVPLKLGDELLGTLSVGSAEPGRFDAADERLLGIIAGQVAVAVQNARLHDRVCRGKREWERTFDAISDPIAVFDNEGRLLRGNTALAAHLRRGVTELANQCCRDLWFCDGLCESCAITRALHQESTRSEVTRPDGRIFSVTTFPVSAGPERASVVQVAKDVTEEINGARRLQLMSEELGAANAQAMAALERLRSTQAQLLQAEKLSAIGQLVAGVAHELNNPLTSVIGFAQLVEEELRESADTPPRSHAALAEDVQRIAQESQRAARIVRNLLAFARRQSAERAPQDVVDLYSRVMTLRAYELRLTGVDVETEFETGLPPVVADGSQLQQALLNLLLNAEQAMRGRSVKKLRVGARFDDAGAAVELFITDSGHGIDRVNLPRIFDPFFTTREVGEGTGLGLSICYGIVRDHGGQILVDSRVGVGTTFSLLLPARVERPGEASPLLVAHGETSEREFLAAALLAWGHQVITAATAAEALSALRTQPLDAAFVDRALLAADVPAWRDAQPAGGTPVPLIAMSLGGEDGEVDRFTREHASAVLAPPFQLRALRAAVRAVSKEYV